MLTRTHGNSNVPLRQSGASLPQSLGCHLASFKVTQASRRLSPPDTASGLLPVSDGTG